MIAFPAGHVLRLSGASLLPAVGAGSGEEGAVFSTEPGRENGTDRNAPSIKKKKTPGGTEPLGYFRRETMETLPLSTGGRGKTTVDSLYTPISKKKKNGREKNEKQKSGSLFVFSCVRGNSSV